MKNRIGLLAMLLILCMLMTPAAAVETLMRGSSGGMVRDLQKMLFETGFLFEEPDGEFGRNTEAAVKWFQEYALLEVTGVADELTMNELTVCWLSFMEEQGIYPYISMEESECPSFCNSWQSGDISMICDFCETHAQMYDFAMNMLPDGDADSVQYAYLTCRNEIIRLYDEWIALLPEYAQNSTAAGKALCLSAMEAQHTAMYDSYEAVNADFVPPDVEYGMLQWMRMQTAWLCQMLNTLAVEE